MKISIITVCYNSAKTIVDSIMSVLSQDYPDIEYIIIDGGSTDGTIDIINKYSAKITKFISEPDNGIYDAMNKGICLASGDIIATLNSDDFYSSPCSVRTAVDAIIKENVDCCYGDLEYVDFTDTSKIIRKWKSKSYIDGLFKLGWHPPHPTFFAKKQVYDKFGTFNTDLSISADYELMLRLLQKNNIKSVYIPHTIVKMRTGGVSNRSIKQIIRANHQCIKAWKLNGLKPGKLTIIKKLYSKLIQIQ